MKVPCVLRRIGGDGFCFSTTRWCEGSLAPLGTKPFRGRASPECHTCIAESRETPPLLRPSTSSGLITEAKPGNLTRSRPRVKENLRKNVFSPGSPEFAMHLQSCKCGRSESGSAHMLRSWILFFRFNGSGLVSQMIPGLDVRAIQDRSDEHGVDRQDIGPLAHHDRFAFARRQSFSRRRRQSFHIASGHGRIVEFLPFSVKKGRSIRCDFRTGFVSLGRLSLRNQSWRVPRQPPLSSVRRRLRSVFPPPRHGSRFWVRRREPD